MNLADDILSPAAVADPYPLFAQLREQGGLAWSDRYRSWVVSSHELVAAAIRDPALSADRISPVLQRRLADDNVDPRVVQTLQLLARWMVFKDPPEHTRLRRLAYRAFTPRRVAAMRGQVAAIVDELLDEIAGRNTVDLIGDFAFPLPAIVIAGMLGVPAADREMFKGWSRDMGTLVFGAMEDQQRHERAWTGSSELAAYMLELVAHYRANPADNLISALAQARDERDVLSEEEVVATGVLLLFGGHETTTNLIGNGLLALSGHPGQAQAWRERPSLTGTAVEELLRFDGPAKAVVRVAGDQARLGEAEPAPGDRVFLLPAAANRDPAVFERPDELDLARDPNPHLGFGQGMHYCLGASLARLEATVALPAILNRFPDLAVTTHDLHWQPVLLNRGVERLPASPGRDAGARATALTTSG